MHIMVILNDAPYGLERTFQGLRMADAMLKLEEDLELTLYLSNDAVLCAKTGQVTPDGYYNVERMLKPIIRRGTVIACTPCVKNIRHVHDEPNTTSITRMNVLFTVPESVMVSPLTARRVKTASFNAGLLVLTACPPL